MATAQPPPGATFVYDTALSSLKEQQRWIDALDTKAGILIAANGVIASLVLTMDSILARAPTWAAIVISGLIFLSLARALLAFATRRYEIAPDVNDLAPMMLYGNDAYLKWNSLPTVLEAIDLNEPKLAQKADLLFYAGLSMLVALTAMTGYFIYSSVS